MSTILDDNYYDFYSLEMNELLNEIIEKPIYSIITEPSLYMKSIIKDDVFLAPNQTIIDYDDNLSLSSHSSSSSLHLSPPTHFLHPISDSKQDKFNPDCFMDIFGSDSVYSFPVIETHEDEVMITKKRKVSITTNRQKRRKKSNSDETIQKKKLTKKSQHTLSFNNHHHQLVEPITNQDNNKSIFQILTEQSIDWCRYCGTTEGVNWRPGPWGKRTLCNKHGCDYKGYGLASRLPRLDLSLFNQEKLKDRSCPIIQYFCNTCQSPENNENPLIHCHGGCSRAYHPQCYTPMIKVNPSVDSVHWYCSVLCKENRKCNKVVVELPRKHVPLMHLLSKSTITKKP